MPSAKWHRGEQIGSRKIATSMISRQLGRSALAMQGIASLLRSHLGKVDSSIPFEADMSETDGCCEAPRSSGQRVRYSSRLPHPVPNG